MHIFKITFAIRIGFVATLLMMGSVTELAGQTRCISHLLEQKKMQDPNYRQRKIRNQQLMDRYIERNAGRMEMTVTIPVVFHVIHNGDDVGTNENLSDAQLMAQLAQLNADFGRTNSDAGNTPAAFVGVAANTMIQFCLATTDPNGNATTGIVRTNLNLDQNACWNANFIDNNIVSGRSWNTAMYLNIFTVQKINNDECTNESVLGYATSPNGTTFETDVAVHAYRTIGAVNSPNPAGGSFGLGRTVTHEVGHWLNLKHVWGDAGGCADDDDVADTPLQNAQSGGCPTFPLTDACTQGNGIMFMNYMDYSDDVCMNMFTLGQGTRMMAAINTLRQGLLNSQCGGGGMNDGYTCANAIEITAPGTFNAPGPNQGNGAIPTSGATHANWYRFTPPMSGMIRIFTCGLAGAGNNHNHVYHVNTGSCATLNLNDVIYTQDRGCTQDPADGVSLTMPVTMGSPIYIEWDDLGGNTGPFTWTLEYVTGGNTCTDYVANDVPIAISGVQAGTITSTINVPTAGTITDVNIKNLTGTHSYVGDLTFTLISPQNTQVVLIQNQCGDNATGFNISLDDEATNALSCPLSGMNTQRPQNMLSAFDGQNPQGNWMLQVNDNFDDDGGSLNGWTLEICVSGGGGNCPPNRAVDDMPIANGTYQAGTQLTSMGSIATGSTVLFRAGNNVELRQNFEIANNANLEIKIEGCQ